MSVPISSLMHQLTNQITLYSLEESGVVTECSIKTKEAEEMLDFNFLSSNVTSKLIMKVGVAVINYYIATVIHSRNA